MRDINLVITDEEIQLLNDWNVVYFASLSVELTERSNCLLENLPYESNQEFKEYATKLLSSLNVNSIVASLHSIQRAKTPYYNNIQFSSLLSSIDPKMSSQSIHKNKVVLSTIGLSILRLYHKLDLVLIPGQSQNIKGIIDIIGLNKIASLADSEEKKMIQYISNQKRNIKSQGQLKKVHLEYKAPSTAKSGLISQGDRDFIVTSQKAFRSNTNLKTDCNEDDPDDIKKSSPMLEQYFSEQKKPNVFLTSTREAQTEKPRISTTPNKNTELNKNGIPYVYL